MINLEITDARGQCKTLQVPDDCTIGKGSACDLQLESWVLGQEHARLLRIPAGILIDDLGTYKGTFVNGERIRSQHGPLAPDDTIGIGSFTLRLVPDTALCGVLVPDLCTDVAQEDRTDLTPTLRARHPRDNVESDQKTERPSSAAQDLAPSHKQLEFEWRQRIHTILLQTMDLRRQDVSSMSDAQLREEAATTIGHIIQDKKTEIPPSLDLALLARQVLDEAVGLGPLEELLDDASVCEIMVNRFDQIYVEREGRLERHPLTFTSDRAVVGVIERIVAPLGRRIDESSPMVDARLKDGSRVNAIIGPLALKGAALTIRKFTQHRLNAGGLVQIGTLNQSMADFLEVCVRARKNILVSGGTGAGKTTLLNILSNFIPDGERIVTVEDAAELKLHHEHLISLEARPPNAEGKGAVSIRDLVRNTLRMRPDRIVVGECRGPESLDMLQAMNTGHEGSLTTLHANTPRDALARLETMVLMAGMDLPLSAIREQIASAIQIIVQQTRFACGSRIVTSITEVTGMESGKFQLQEIFRFVNKGYGDGNTGRTGKIQGYLTGCNMIPNFYEPLQASGAGLDIDLFMASPLNGDSHER